MFFICEPPESFQRVVAYKSNKINNNLESNPFKLENVCVFLSRCSEQCLCLHQVWVADRANWRIQVFEKITGEWLGSWDNCFTEDGPYSVRFTPDQQYIIVAHLNISKISILAAPPVGLIGDCIVVDTIQLAGEVKPHLLDVSLSTGAIYVAEIGAEQVQKYVPLD
uniref:NHL repeat containing 3 n=1 Tax=Naja naja TaxID=35670 RepID=A0A8C6XK37_NAJNA